MAITRWKKPEGLPVMFDEMDRLFGRYLRYPLMRAFEGEDFDFGPAIDVFETPDEVVVKAELPGVEQENVDVTLEESRLILSGHTREEQEVQEDGYLRREIRSGSFRRAIPLPGPVKDGEVSAIFENGILTVRLPKVAPEPPGKKIEVKQPQKPHSH